MEQKKATTTPGSAHVKIIAAILAFAAVIVGLFQETIALWYWFGVGISILGFGFLIAYALRLLEDILATLHAHAQDYQSINFRRREQ